MHFYLFHCSYDPGSVLPLSFSWCSLIRLCFASCIRAQNPGIYLNTLVKLGSRGALQAFYILVLLCSLEVHVGLRRLVMKIWYAHVPSSWTSMCKLYTCMKHCILMIPSIWNYCLKKKSNLNYLIGR